MAKKQKATQVVAAKTKTVKESPKETFHSIMSELALNYNLEFIGHLTFLNETSVLIEKTLGVKDIDTDRKVKEALKDLIPDTSIIISNPDYPEQLVKVATAYEEGRIGCVTLTAAVIDYLGRVGFGAETYLRDKVEAALENIALERFEVLTEVFNIKAEK